MSNASTRYIVNDVAASADFYTAHLGFTIEQDARPAFCSVVRGPIRLLLSGEGSSGAKAMPDGRKPVPGGWNRILVPVDDIEAEVARLRLKGLIFRNEILKGVGGSQVLLEDPSEMSSSCFSRRRERASSLPATPLWASRAARPRSASA